MAPSSETRLRRIMRTTDVNVHKGKPLPTRATHRPVPARAVNATSTTVLLASSAMNVVGSFAPTIDDAGFSYIPTETSAHIYWDGSNGSRVIVRRRADGFKEPLPKGSIIITGIASGAPGAPGPTFFMYPYFIPGTCSIGWVRGNAGVPKFAHLSQTNDAAHEQSSGGKEPLADGAIRIQLLGVPAPPAPGDPPPPEPVPTPPAVPQDPISPVPPAPLPIGSGGYCVMKGTEIIPIGESPFWLEEKPQNDWWQVVTDKQRKLEAVPEHLIVTGRAGYTEMRDVRKGDIIITLEGEEKVGLSVKFSRPGIKVCLHMEHGHLAWFNGILGHNLKKLTD